MQYLKDQKKKVSMFPRWRQFMRFLFVPEPSFCFLAFHQKTCLGICPLGNLFFVHSSATAP